MPKYTMGTFRGLARWVGGLFMFLTVLSRPGGASVYTPNSWLIALGGAYGNINPSALSALTGNYAQLHDLIGFSFRVERGLAFPDWSHWMEFQYFSFTEADDGIDSVTQKTGNSSFSLKYMSVMPVGATYWFERTSKIDLGLSLGLGLAFSPQVTIVNTRTSSTNVVTTATSTGTGGVGFAGELRLEARFWFNRFLAFTGGLGFRYYSTQIAMSTGTTVQGDLTAYTGNVALSYCFGGGKGVAGDYVEVMHKNAPRTSVLSGPTPGQPVSTPQGVAPPAAPTPGRPSNYEGVPAPQLNR